MSRRYTTNGTNLDANYGIRIVSLVLTITWVIVFFELTPERSVWSIPVKQAEEHVLAVPGSGGLSVMLMHKQEAGENKAATKEEYKKQYHIRTRILIIDDEPDFNL